MLAARLSTCLMPTNVSKSASPPTVWYGSDTRNLTSNSNAVGRPGVVHAGVDAVDDLGDGILDLVVRWRAGAEVESVLRRVDPDVRAHVGLELAVDRVATRDEQVVVGHGRRVGDLDIERRAAGAGEHRERDARPGNRDDVADDEECVGETHRQQVLVAQDDGSFTLRNQLVDVVHEHAGAGQGVVEVRVRVAARLDEVERVLGADGGGVLAEADRDRLAIGGGRRVEEQRNRVEARIATRPAPAVE